MSIWRRFDGHGFPSLVTTNVADRRPIFGEPCVAGHLQTTIEDVLVEEGVKAIAWAIMPDHLHIVLSTPRAKSVGRVVQMMKGRFAREFNQSRGASGSVWQERYHERALRNERHLWAAVQYVLYNPVKAGIVNEWTEYPWCHLGQPMIGQAKA